MSLVTKCGIDLKLGIVQTAYANGGSTDYIGKELVKFRYETNHSYCTVPFDFTDLHVNEISISLFYRKFHWLVYRLE